MAPDCTDLCVDRLETDTKKKFYDTEDICTTSNFIFVKTQPMSYFREIIKNGSLVEWSRADIFRVVEYRAMEPMGFFSALSLTFLQIFVSDRVGRWSAVLLSAGGHAAGVR